MELELLRSPADFLAAAGDHLSRTPVESTVVATVVQRLVSGEEQQPPHPDDWWLVVRDHRGEVVGAGMRTAPFEPRPVCLLAMPDAAAVDLARLLCERGEEVRAVTGALPAARLFAQETARLTGTTTQVHTHTRLFELGRLVVPRSVVGRLRVAEEADLPLVRRWFAAFLDDADAQAGRVPDPHGAPSEATLRGRLVGRRIWLWEDADGRVVHLTGSNPPSLGVSRIGPVYTPPEERGRGWASAAVAAVSAALVADGVRVCLFTDQANPISNRIYERLGFEPVVDMADLRIGAPTGR